MGRNAEVNQQIKADRREAILAAAIVLFTRKGLEGTKTSDITAAAGISQGLLYHYFASKEAIFIALIETALQKMNAACRLLEEMPLSPGEKVRLAIARLLEGLVHHTETPQYYLLIAQATVSEAIPEEAKQIISKENRMPYEVMTRIFAAGQTAGDFRDDSPAMLAQMFWTTFTGLSIYKAVHNTWFIPPNPEMIWKMFAKE